MKSSFTKSDTLVVKGVALLAMMWHHCFLPGRYEGYVISYWPLAQSQVENIAAFLKICVSLFAIVSGYGLYLSLKNRFHVGHELSSRETSQWLVKRYVRTFSGYWLIVVLAWIITSAIDMRPRNLYYNDNIYLSLLNMLLDFLGVGKLFGTPIMVSTWWYMSAAFVFIISAPLLYWLLERFGSFFCIAMLLIVRRIGEVAYPGGIDFFTFIPAFCAGMIIAKEGLFDWLAMWLEGHPFRFALGVVFSAAATFLCYRIDHSIPKSQFWELKYGFFPVVYVVFIYLTAARIPVVKSVLAFLGKHSANVFLIHTFLREVYLSDFINTRGNFMVMILVLLAMSLALALVLEGIKKIVRYDVMIEKLIKRIDHGP